MTSKKSHRAKRTETRSSDRTGHSSGVPGSGKRPGRQRRQSEFIVLLGILCSVALLLRLVNVLQTVEMPTVVQLLGDAKGYYDWASRIAGGQWYGSETFYQAPLYPYLLACQIKFFGSGVLGMRLFQGLLGTLSVFLLGIAGRELFRPSVGLVAAAMYAVYPPAIYFDGIIQKTSLASFLLCVLLAQCALVGAERLNRSRRPWALLLIGVTLGLLLLTRENAILWVPVIPAWLWLGLELPRRQRGILISAYLAGLALVLVPVAARNASLGGEWSPTTFQAGPNFYIGNNLESNGLYRPLVPGHETPMYERADAQRLAEEASGRTLSSREVSKFWFGRAQQEIRQDPGRWIQLLALKSLMVINRFEVPDVECMYVYRDYSWPLRLLGPIWHFGLLCPLAVWGITVTRDRWRQLWLYYLLILVMIGAIVMFFILGRYRQPLVPLLVLFAAPGLLDIWNRLRERNWQGIRVPLIASALALAACNLKVHDESMLRSSSYMNLGIAAGQAGNLAVSIPALARAIQTHPEMAEAHVNLGRAMDLSNRIEDAIVCYQNALTIDPTLVMVDAMLAADYEQLGAIDQAIVHYRRAVQIDPRDEASRAALQRLQGQPAGVGIPPRN